MEKIIEILEGIQPGENFAELTDIIDGHRIDSLSIITLIAELEEAFDIEIPTTEIIPSNLNSVSAIKEMVDRMSEDN